MTLKKRYLVAVAAMMATICVQAQRLQTVDKDGLPVPYASVINEDGKFIGTTDLDGVIEDVKGAKVVSITHVAYQAKKVRVGQGGRVALDDADFGLPEITVTKKPLVYVQTYYRMFFMSDDADMPIYYYRAGVLDNSYERQKKNVSSSEDHFSACNNKLIKTVLNTLLGTVIKRIAGLKTEKVEDRMKKRYKDIGIAFSPNGPGKQRITDKYGVVGAVQDNQDKGERRYSYESRLLSKHLVMAKGNKKKMDKAEKKEERQKDRIDQDFIVYRIDEDGSYLPEDNVMSQVYTSYYDTKDNDHVNILAQVFTVERAYVTKEELKRLKKKNKMKMTYENLQNFERVHNIPAIPADLRKHIVEIVK